MFYSHEILTSRQYGVATIWLVATLGQKSNLKKVTRRAILEVDLPKACKTITEPELPMALRLQGSLLFGVSRVFSQQCGYVLTDVTTLWDKMRGTEHVFKEMEIDPEVGKTRPEQLNISEDPLFIPDLHLNFDLSGFGLTSEDFSVFGAPSPRTLPSSQSSLLLQEEEEDPQAEPGADIPCYDTPYGSGGIGGFEVAAGIISVRRSGSKAGQIPSVFDNEPVVHDEPVFDVGDDGALLPAGEAVSDADLAVADAEQAALGTPMDEMEGIEPQAGPTEEEGPRQNIPVDDEGVVFGDDEPAMQSTEAPVTPPPADPEERRIERAESSVHPSHESSETAEAPQRRVRQPKAIRPDQRTELSNRDLTDWNQNYLANMAAALTAKRSQISHFEAKKNAEFFILHQGIGNIASNFGDDQNPHPLAIFSGQSLWDLLRGVPAGTKRSRSGSSVGDDEDDGGRRVRTRTVSHEEVARGEDGDQYMFADDDGLIQGDDINIESEVGRAAPPSLPDHSSGMPWNVSASRHSSAQPLGSGLLPRLSSSVGGLAGGMELGPPSNIGRRRSRLTSASPLLGRGPSISRAGSQEPSPLTGNEDEFADLDAQLALDADADFELYGPSAVVDTQTAAQSQWIAATLENEAYNFLTFVSTQIQTRAEQEQEPNEEEGLPVTNITFEELLPPTTNSQAVGAQGLLHVLALATKGLLEVHQAEAFGSIEIAVVSH
ncbi:hypothetical protein PV11_01151 [Exophiala sideris]|uniref:Rad21/Rec8-like protein N-terminal domain-containing protein n=1 Tax=Exophiala sideris TaxID=1016849 RepID=A0A0D1ZFD0_9EURO|nr:hypothetical protein PV11_01151 [Exophiala sideris]